MQCVGCQHGEAPRREVAPAPAAVFVRVPRARPDAAGVVVLAAALRPAQAAPHGGRQVAYEEVHQDAEPIQHSSRRPAPVHGGGRGKGHRAAASLAVRGEMGVATLPFPSEAEGSVASPFFFSEPHIVGAAAAAECMHVGREHNGI